MFGIGIWELLLILGLALLVLGPKKLPEAARMIGKGVREFRQASRQFTSAIELEVDGGLGTPIPRPDPNPRQSEPDGEAADLSDEALPAGPQPPLTDAHTDLDDAEANHDDDDADDDDSDVEIETERTPTRPAPPETDR